MEEAKTPDSEKIVIKSGLFEVIGPNHGLVKLANAATLPVKTSYWLSRLIKKINSEAETYHKERQKIIDRLCDRDEKGEPVSVGPGMISLKDHQQEFMEAMNKLGDIDISIDINKIKIKLAEIPEGVISAMDFPTLEPFVEITE